MTPIATLLALPDRWEALAEAGQCSASGPTFAKELRDALTACQRAADGKALGEVLWETQRAAQKEEGRSLTQWADLSDKTRADMESYALAVVLAASGREAPSVEELAKIFTKARDRYDDLHSQEWCLNRGIKAVRNAIIGKVDVGDAWQKRAEKAEVELKVMKKLREPQDFMQWWLRYSTFPNEGYSAEDKGEHMAEAYKAGWWAALQYGEREFPWVLCSERMPTREDGDSFGKVVWLRYHDKRPEIFAWDAPNAIQYCTHWTRIPQLPSEPPQATAPTLNSPEAVDTMLTEMDRENKEAIKRAVAERDNESQNAMELGRPNIIMGSVYPQGFVVDTVPVKQDPVPENLSPEPFGFAQETMIVPKTPKSLTDVVDKLHIIIGPNGMCMCGTGGKTCRDILSSISEDVSKAILCNSFGGTRLEGQEEALEELGG